MNTIATKQRVKAATYSLDMLKISEAKVQKRVEYRENVSRRVSGKA